MTAVADSRAVDKRLTDVLDRLPADLDRWHAPGLELAAVRGGEPVVATGIGSASLDPTTPVGAQTLFHHGSCGKAYTALLAVLLAENGQLDLDVPVRTYVPELRLPDPVVAERATVRDLLSHRSGLARNDLAWILNPSWSGADLVTHLAHLPLCGDLRGQWQYSNFGYALTGLAMERVTGSDFADLVHKHVVDATGQGHTWAAPRIGDEGATAEPYVLRDGAAVKTTPRAMPVMAPAGGIVSCAEDSVQWLLVQLGHGPIDPDVVRRTHHLQIPVPPEATEMFPELRLYGYAMGWMVATFRGRRLLWHSGGIDGYSTYAVLLPDDDVGVLASTNLHMTQTLTLAVVLDVADALIGETAGEFWTDRLFVTPEVPAPAPRDGEPTPSTHPLTAYIGTFSNAGYGDLTVSPTSVGLELRLGECAVTALHRHYDTWDVTYEPLDAKGTVTFHTDAGGTVAEAVAAFEVNDTGPVRYVRAPC